MFKDITVYANPFIKNNDQYVRDYNIVRKYINDSAFYVHKMKAIPLDEASELVKKVIAKDGPSPMNNPKVLMLERTDSGDKFQKEYSVLDYIKSIEDSKDTCAPTMTTYIGSHCKVSKYATFLKDKMAKRKTVKKQAQLFQMEKNPVMALRCEILQKAIKTIINSLSGAHGSAGTPLYNHSAHPTLTSTGRCATSYANANNERFLEGMRHYSSYEVTQSDIVAIVSNTDYDKLKHTMDQYSIVYPSTQDVMRCVIQSTLAYWRDDDLFNRLTKLVNTFSPLEKAAYLYTQDCYNLYRLNPTLVQTMITDFHHCPDEICDNADYWMSFIDDDMLMTVSLIASDILKGRTVNALKENDYQSYQRFASVVKHFIEVREKYKQIIETFWRTDHIPSSIANYPSAIRKAVIVSDTDSTIFTVSNWVERVKGKLGFGKSEMSVAAVMVYFASQTLKHVLAIFSANMGVSPDKVFQLTMKNEYMMESLMLTTKSKHYAYNVVAREGNVYSSSKLELKGKTLRDSKIPDSLRNELKKMISDVLEDIHKGEGINVLHYLNRVGNLERNIMNEIIKGSSNYLTRERIQEKATYRLPKSSNYFYYDLWQTVFADKYGPITTLPASCVKVSLPITNKTMTREWIASITDKEIAKRLEAYLKATGRDVLSMLLVPLEITSNTGIPQEIIDIMNMRKIIYASMEGFYLVLESIGYYCKNKHDTRLIMDTY